MSKAIIRKLLACVLCLSLVLGFCASGILVFAQENKTKESGKVSYLSLGDSMSNGYGLPGYDHNGYWHAVADAYPTIVADHFGWELTPLAVSGIRAEDLCFLLTLPYENAELEALIYGTPEQDGYTRATHGANYDQLWWKEVQGPKWEAQIGAGDYYTWFENVMRTRFNDPYYDVLAAEGKGYGSGTLNMAKTFQTAVKEADVINLALGNANFGVFLRYLVQNAVNGSANANAWVDADKMIAQADDSVSELLAAVREALTDAVMGTLGEADAEAAVDACVFAVASYAINYAKVMELILEMNPDADIIMMGVMNTLNGMEVMYEGKVLDLGELAGILFEMLNYFTANTPANHALDTKYPDAKFSFCTQSDISLWAENFADVAVEWEKYPVIRDRFVHMVCYKLFPMVQNTQSRLVYLVRSDVEAYEAAQAAGYQTFAQYVQENQTKAYSVAVYKAFENAIVKCYGQTIPDVKSLMFMNDMSPLLADITAVYQNETELSTTEMWFAVVEQVIVPLLQKEGKDVDLEKALEMLEDPAYKVYLELAQNVCKSWSTPNTYYTALLSDVRICDVLHMFAKTEIGDGIGCHPNPAGHRKLADSVIAAYGVNTPDQQTKTSITNIAKSAINLLDYYENQPYYYTAGEDSFYLAFGNDVAAGNNSYVDQVAAQLNIPYQNLATSGAAIGDVFTLINEHTQLIQKADLITLDYSGVAATTAFFDTIFNVETEPKDWAALVGEENVPMVEQVLEEMRATIAEQGMGGNFMGMDLEELLPAAMESYAYVYISNLRYQSEAADAIHAINPDAMLVLVGTYDDLEDVTLELGGKTLDVGQYTSYLVKILNISSVFYGLTAENTTFIYAPDVETVLEKDVAAGGYDHVGSLTYLFKVTMIENRLPSDAGQTYLKDQILATMTERPLPGGMLGDINGDETINSADVTLLFRYVSKDATLNTFTAEQLLVADVNQDGVINSSDISVLFRYVSKDTTLEWTPVKLKK